ncbi:MAG: hypothetical protein L0216_21665 [Planctomycetales bacterium]|nr:hypothetical protein [Planctomycetales bacterium]
MLLFIWLAIFVVLSFYVAHYLRFLYRNPVTRILLGPGVFCGNLGRLIGCQATFTPRTQTKLFERDGVKYEKCPAPLVGHVVIATTTFLLPLLALFGANSALGFPLRVGLADLPTVPLSVDESFSAIVNLDDQALRIVTSLGLAFEQHGMASPHLWLFVYIAGTCVLGAAPMRRDVKHLLAGLLVVFVLGRATGLFPSGALTFSDDWLRADPALSHAWDLLLLAVFVLFPLFLLVVALDILKKVREVALEPDEISPTPSPAPRPGSARTPAT